MSTDGQIPRDALVGNLKTRYTWKQVERPAPWQPKHEGEKLVGFFAGKTIHRVP